MPSVHVSLVPFGGEDIFGQAASVLRAEPYISKTATAGAASAVITGFEVPVAAPGVPLKMMLVVTATDCTVDFCTGVTPDVASQPSHRVPSGGFKEVFCPPPGHKVAIRLVS